MNAAMTKLSSGQKASKVAYVELARVDIPYEVKKSMFKSFEEKIPEITDISDEEIQAEVNSVRYGKKFI